MKHKLDLDKSFNKSIGHHCSKCFNSWRREADSDTWRGSPFQAAAALYPAHGRGGGTYVPPHRFFADSRKMAARSAAKFGIAVQSSFAHVV